MAESDRLSELTIAELPRHDVVAKGCPSERVCRLCGGPLSVGNWLARLRNKAGKPTYDAHTHCAHDKGWVIK